jgi:hypothetical protein
MPIAYYSGKNKDSSQGGVFGQRLQPSVRLQPFSFRLREIGVYMDMVMVTV